MTALDVTSSAPTALAGSMAEYRPLSWVGQDGLHDRCLSTGDDVCVGVDAVTDGGHAFPDPAGDDPTDRELLSVTVLRCGERSAPRPVDRVRPLVPRIRGPKWAQ